MRVKKGSLAVAWAALPLIAWAGSYSVQVEFTPLRSAPSFFSAASGKLAYGDRVELRDEQKDWMHVEFQGVSGWVHESALSKKKIVVQAGAEDQEAAASGEELALAGKGFSAEVEAEYQSRHPDADFAVIDRAEKIQFSPEDAARFLRAGGLQVGGEQ